MAAPQGGGGQQDNSMGIIWGVAATFASLGVIWFVFKSKLVYVYLSLKLVETHLLNALSGDRFTEVERTITIAMHNTKDITFGDLILIGDAVGDVLRWPLLLLMIVLALVVYFGNSAGVFKNTYDMKNLANLEKDNWPQIIPSLGQEIIKQDLDKGPWAMAMQPMQFCKRYRLLEEIRPQRREGMPRSEWNKIEVVLKRGEANRIFAMQLGQLWNSPERLPPHARALFAVFAARANADSKAAADVLKRLNLSCKSKQLDMTGVDELLKKHAGSKLIKGVVNSHAYVLTVMFSMLEAARLDGVQATADFLWLKLRDRRLWYTLNTVGRQTPFVEVAGIFAHWRAEKEAGRRLLVPMIEEATNALELALKEVIYMPDEEE